MTSQIENPVPTSLVSSPPGAPSGVPIPTATFDFINIPDQIFTCTNQTIFWNSTNIFSQPDHLTNDTIADLWPFSVLTVGIAGLVNSSEAEANGPLVSLLPLISEVVSAPRTETNLTIILVDMPPGVYAFYAVLSIVPVINGTLPIPIPIERQNFTSAPFAIVNGTNTDCVIFSSLPNPSSTSLISALRPYPTSFSGQDLRSASADLNGGAIAGITIGSIVAIFLIFLAAFSRSRIARSHSASGTFDRMSFAILKPKEEKRRTTDFVGLQSFDLSYVPPEVMKDPSA